MKIKQFYHQNQFVIFNTDEIVFQSYNSTIAKYNTTTRTLTLGNDWDYSVTTSKHLYMFIEDYVDDCKIWEVREATNKRKFIQNLIAEKYITLGRF